MKTLTAALLALMAGGVGFMVGRDMGRNDALRERNDELRAMIEPVTYYCVRPDGGVVPLLGGTAEQCHAFQVAWRRP